MAKWKWLDDKLTDDYETWQPYDPETNNQIEEAYNSGASSVELNKGSYYGKTENQIHLVIFDRNQHPPKYIQRNKQTNKTRTLKRESRKLQQHSLLPITTLTQISKQLKDYGFNQNAIDQSFKIFNTKHNKNYNMLNNTESIINEIMDIIQHQSNSNNESKKDPDEPHPQDPYYAAYNVGDWIEVLNHDVWVPAEIIKTEPLNSNTISRAKLIYAEYQDSKTLKQTEIKLHGLKDKNKFRVLGTGFYSDAHAFNFEYDDDNDRNKAKNAKHPAAYINRPCFKCRGTGVFTQKKNNVPKSYPCLKCNARGTVQLSCNKCDNGIFKAAFSMKHNKCNGEGCGACNDSGRYPLQDWKCKACKGSGQWKTVKCGTCKGSKVYTPRQTNNNNNNNNKEIKCNACIGGYFMNKTVGFTPKRDSMKVHGEPGDNNVIRLYHATDKAGADGIKDLGVMFRGKGGSYGGGIYFAASAKVAKERGRQSGYLVVADVFVGKCKDEQSISLQMDFETLNGIGYDSIRGKWSQYGVEYVVYNWDQVWVGVVVPFDKVDLCKLI